MTKKKTKLIFLTCGIFISYMIIYACFVYAVNTVDSKNVSWMAEITIKEDKVKDFKELIKIMSQEVKGHGLCILNYEWYQVDGNKFFVYERYKNSLVTQEHLKWFNDKYAQKMIPMFDFKQMPKTFTIYGLPDEATKTMLREMTKAEIIFTKPIEGFSR